MIVPLIAGEIPAQRPDVPANSFRSRPGFRVVACTIGRRNVPVIPRRSHESPRRRPRRTICRFCRRSNGSSGGIPALSALRVGDGLTISTGLRPINQGFAEFAKTGKDHPSPPSAGISREHRSHRGSRRESSGRPGPTRPRLHGAPASSRGLESHDYRSGGSKHNPAGDACSPVQASSAGPRRRPGETDALPRRVGRPSGVSRPVGQGGSGNRDVQALLDRREVDPAEERATPGPRDQGHAAGQLPVEPAEDRPVIPDGDERPKSPDPAIPDRLLDVVGREAGDGRDQRVTGPAIAARGTILGGAALRAEERGAGPVGRADGLRHGRWLPEGGGGENRPLCHKHPCLA